MKYILALTILLFTLDCGGKKKEEILSTESIQESVTITFFSGDASIYRNGILVKPSQGLQLGSEDEIRTGKSGRVEVLVRNSGLIKVSSDTSLSVSSILREGDSADTNVHLNYGKVVAVVKKEKKNDNYNVVTPTLVAGVRGTIFSTSVENLDSREGKITCTGANCVVKVEVVEGMVAVRKKNSKEEVVLEKNTSVTSRGGEEIRPNSVLPLGKESLEGLKDMLVFHKDSLGGFENLIDEAKKSSQALQEMDRRGGLEETKKVLSSKTTSRSNDEVRKVAEEIDTRKYLEKDLAKDKLKLESKESF